MTRQEIAALVQNHGFGVLSLAAEGRAYGLPLFYGYDGVMVYFQSHPGLKDEYLRNTSEGCLTIVKVDSWDDWESVQMAGPVRRLTREKEILIATDVLMRVPFPPEFGFVAHRTPSRSTRAMYLWSLKPDRITGRKSMSKTASMEVDAGSG